MTTCCAAHKLKPALMLTFLILLTAILHASDENNINIPPALIETKVNPLVGPFNAQSVVYYIVHYGGDLKINIGFERWRNKPAGETIIIPQTVFFQVYDAAENQVHSQYWRFPEKHARTKYFDYNFKDAPAGIYQVRTVMSQEGRLMGHLNTQPATNFGVMASRCMMALGGKNLKSAYFYVPPQADKIEVYSKSVITHISDDNGKVIASTKIKKKEEIPLTPQKVFRIDFDIFGSVGFGKFPVILCPDIITAQNINASVETSSDGRLFAHKFQVMMYEWIKNLKPEQLTVKAVDLITLKDKFEQKPESAFLLGHRGALSHAKYLFESQDVNPDSPQFGSDKDYSYLGLLFGLDEPFNPYHGNINILNRYLLNRYRNLLKLKENDTFHEGYQDYSGGDALGTLSDYIGFYLVYKDLPANEKSLLFNGTSRLINRFCLSRVSCENQSSHWLVDSYCMYKATGDAVYKTIAADYAENFSNPDNNKFIKTGYMQEKYGPDATYQGLCASNLAYYYAMSKDENIKEALKTIYTFFNHTVAPEPDGKIYGASNFSHRTNGSWVERQWSGGIPQMAGTLAQAGCWIGKKRINAEDYLKKEITWPSPKYAINWYKENSKWAIGYNLSPWLSMWDRYFYPVNEVMEGKLPAVESDNFSRNFGNELLAVRKPEYYALIYTGKTSYDWAGKNISQEPILKGWKLEGDTLVATTSDASKLGWSPTQGLSLFWTPKYGNCLMSRNWNVYTAQTVRADLNTNKVSWADYWSTKSEFNADNSIVTINSKLYKSDTTVQRTIKTMEKSVEVTINVSGIDQTKMTRIVEQLPFLLKPEMQIEYGNAGKWSKDPGNCKEIRLSNTQGAAVTISFNKEVTAARGFSSVHKKVKIGLIEILLKADKTGNATLTYRISNANKVN